MLPLRPRTAVAAGLLLALTGVSAGSSAVVSAAPVAHAVLSVSSGFHTSSLPAGTRVVANLTHVGAVEVTTPATALRTIAGLPHVRGVWPDYALHTTSDSTSSTGGVLAPAAVGGTAGTASAGSGVGVAVLDTGVADTEALKHSNTGHLRRGPDFSGDTSDRRDGFGHGTFMADLIAGGAVDGKVIGVAPGSTVVDVKVAKGDGSTDLGRVLKGLNWVADQGVGLGVRVVSLSLSADLPTGGYGSDPLTDGADAVQKAGATVVVAAGNDASEVSDPGQDPQLFTIGAADTSAGSPSVATFSGRGFPAGMRKPDVVAPGLHLLSILPGDSVIGKANPTSKTGKLWRGSGTSEATAVAAGAVAIFLSGRSNVTAQDVRASFGTAARDIGAGDAQGYGLLVTPTTLVDGEANLSPPPGSPGANPDASSWSSTSWSSTSWSSTSWSSTSWSSTSWSSTSWSSTSWSSTSWSSTSWSSTSWSASSWS